MDFKARLQYEKQLEFMRKLSEEDDAVYKMCKERNPKYVREIQQSLEISGYHISITTFEKPLLIGYQRDEFSVQQAKETRQRSIELRQELQEELDDFAKRHPYASKEDEQAMAELQAIKDKYADGLKLREDNVRRKIKNLKAKIQSNFDIWTHFITLSYHVNMVDIKKSKGHLKEWLKKMSSFVPDFAYVYVMEFQERGAIHYHILCRCVKEDGKWFKNKDFKEILDYWKHGSTDAKGISQKYIPKAARDKAKAELNTEDGKMIAVWSLGSYLTSYLEKGSDSMLLFNSHMYGASRGLKDSIKITDSNKIAQLLKYLKVDELKENTYHIEIPETENRITKKYYNKLIKLHSDK